MTYSIVQLHTTSFFVVTVYITSHCSQASNIWTMITQHKPIMVEPKGKTAFTEVSSFWSRGLGQASIDILPEDSDS